MTESKGELEMLEEPEPQEASKDAGDDSRPAIPQELAILSLKDTVIYPDMSVPLVVGRPTSRKLVDSVILGSRILGLAMQRDPDLEEPQPEDLHEMGTAAQIVKLLKFPDGNLRVMVKGLSRIRVQRYTATEPFLKARVEVLHDSNQSGLKVDAMVKNVSNLLRKMFGLMPIVPEELSVMLMNVEEPGRLADAVAAVLLKDTEKKQEVLETLDVRKRLESITRFLTQEIEVLELGSKIQEEVQEQMGKTQRDYILRQQLKAIQKELGDEDETAALIREMEEKIEAAQMPEEALAEAMRELNRLKVMPAAAAEHTVSRTYLEWMVDLPWSVTTRDKIDVARARAILDEDHFDLEKIKERILEYLAVRKLKEDMKGPILCFAGPPGTGKTSLGKSIARAMGRRFHRMSLGGVRDEAEIRGHRRTYVGALPGRIIQALRKVKTRNPVIMLDEIDKLGADFRGDPSSALLEVLDPEQNGTFADHYLGVSFDLSKVLFIATANILDTIPGPLRDRMEVLSLAGYILTEKVEIAKRYLVPRQLEEHGLTSKNLAFQPKALQTMVEGYTREAGVRNLERTVASVARKVARQIAEAKRKPRKVTIKKQDLEEYLGPVQYESELAERTAVPGVATGLAWTPTGGDILFVESSRMPGSRNLVLTGQLGDVMKESARTALSLLRSRAESLGIPREAFKDTDIHIHVPAGAIPKDGPSAGVTMATSLASLFLDKPVGADLAMTGEITLRGKVLPVGGVKEKVLAAHRAGLKRVVLPARNEKDLREIPDEIREQMEFIYAGVIDDVWKAALEQAPRRARSKKKSGGSGGSGDSKKSKPSRKASPRRKTGRAAAAQGARS